MEPSETLDLEAYLARTGYSGAREPTLESLADLQAAHLFQIPFENIDVLLGRPIRLDLALLQAKLVDTHRGGYCFEQNTLFSAALRELGFRVATLEARVRPPGKEEPLPRTHMLLRVDIDGAAWLADVGFGGDGPLQPVSLAGHISEQPGGTYRIEHEPDGIHVLQRQLSGDWHDLYAFGLTPALSIDFEMANYHTSTHPESIFVDTLTAQIFKPSERHFLRGSSYLIRREDQEIARGVEASELPRLLREIFGLDLSDQEIVDIARLTG